jgi:hypothetical protein
MKKFLLSILLVVCSISGHSQKVTVESGATLIIERGLGVTIKNGFECKQGAEFVIQ